MPELNDRQISRQGWALISSPTIPNMARSLSDAEVHYVNMTALTRGRLLSSFWVVDRKHIYIGSAGMNWRALSKVKNFGLEKYLVDVWELL